MRLRYMCSSYRRIGVVTGIIILIKIAFDIFALSSSRDRDAKLLFEARSGDVDVHDTWGRESELATREREAATRKRELQTYLEQRAVRVEEVDCLKLFQGDPQELKRAAVREQAGVDLPADTDILKLASNCSAFVQQYGFILDPLTYLEEQFPLAFSILTFKDASQVVDLLRTVYRPQNFYCIHVDRKSQADFFRAMEAVSQCLPNVFLASRRTNVKWGTYYVLEPEITCMEDLWKKKMWKYFINLTGQEFPLKTNYELVRILTAFRGANDIDSFVPDSPTKTRWSRFLPAPANISLYKGAAHIVASRAFVHFVLHEPVAQRFLQWCKPTAHTSEHFFNSLDRNRHLQAPGGYLGNETSTKSLARYKNWVPNLPCPGKKVVRGICILNVLDLPALYRRPELFANKFHMGYSRLALQCLAQELHNRTVNQTMGRVHFDVSRYEQFALDRHTQY